MIDNETTAFTGNMRIELEKRVKDAWNEYVSSIPDLDASPDEERRMKEALLRLRIVEDEYAHVLKRTPPTLLDAFDHELSSFLIS